MFARRSRVPVVGSVLLAMLMVVTACGSAPKSSAPAPAPVSDAPAVSSDAPAKPPVSSAPAPDVITVGYSIALDGMYAAQARGQDLAVQLWADWVNAEGGMYVPEYDKRIPVKLITYNDGSSVERMLRNYERLIEQDKVDLVFPPISELHVPLSALVERYGIPVVGSTMASSRVRDLKVKNMWFPTAAMPDRQMVSLVGLLKANSASIKTVAIATVQESYAKECLDTLVPLLKEAGIEIVLNKSYPTAPEDLTPLIMEMKSKNPDAFIGLTFPTDTFLMMRQFPELGFNPKLVSLLVGPGINVFPDLFGNAIEGIVFVAEWSPNADWPRARKFYDEYVARFGERPDYLNSILALQAAEVVEQAVAKVGLNNDALREYIANNEFMTARGPTRFEGVENFGTPAMWAQWQNGEVELVWPREYATADLILPKPAWP